MQPAFERSPHLVQQIAHAERLAARLETTPDAELLDRAALASVRLDGSVLDRVPTGEEQAVPTSPEELAPDDLADPPQDVVEDDGSRTWVDAMGFVHHHDGDLANLEFVGARAALDADDLAPGLLVDPIPALAELHRRLTRGLVAPDRAGEPRITKQVVHDASVGRLLYFPAEPAEIPARIAALGAWLVSEGSREHALITSGVLHFELLQVHPFEAANGRLARAAARLVLRARGLDPGGRAAVELVLAEDALGYLEEVARTTRRRDLTIWLERWAEAVVEALRRAAREAGALPDLIPDRAASFLAADGPPAFTVADYREAAGADLEGARSDLVALQDAGHVRLVPGARGLRYARR